MNVDVRTAGSEFPLRPGFLYICPMLRFLVALLLLASPAIAQVTAEPRSVMQFEDEVVLRFIVSVDTDQQLLITNAVLLDDTDRVYALAAEPSGIQSGTRGVCALGGLMLAGSRQLVAMRFWAPHPEPPLTLVMELQTPDPTAQLGCRTLTLTVEGFQP